jgi:beta-mannosidase
MIRCWGGSVYEDHEFFDICDREGLLVWQDFMLACETPSQSEWFKKELYDEAVSVIKKLRQHPSLALWCGDNECDLVSFFGIPRRWKPSMNSITRQVLPVAVFENDPVRDYLPGSPYMSDELKEKNCPDAAPEQHLWGPRDSWKNPFYLNNTAIFAGEIGYHGMPSAASVRKFIPAGSVNARSADDPNWLCHASQAFGDLNGPYACRIGAMNDQLLNTWGFIPESIEDYAIMSQVVQAEALKFFIEAFRCKKWQKTGIIWWNMIDCWPQFSDAVVDYYYDRKLAFYYIKNAQKPVMLIFDEPHSWNIRLHGVNDLDHPVEITYRVTDFVSGEVLMKNKTVLAADSASEIDAMKVYQCDERIYCIDFSYENCHEKSHCLLATLPYSWDLYRKFLKEYYPGRASSG